MIAEAKEETYEDVRLLIFKLARQIQCCDQCSVEDRIGTAMEWYTRAYLTYDPSRGTKFSTWVYWQVRGGLLIRRKKCIKQSQRFKNNGSTMDGNPGQGQDRLRTLMFELSDDARKLIIAITETSDEIVKSWLRKQDREEAVRKCFKEWKWSLCRWHNVFNEIGDAI